MKQILNILLPAVVILANTATAQWTVQHPASSYADLFAVHALDASTFVAAGDHGHILRTTDRGVTWSTVHRGDSSHLMLSAISFSSSTHGAAVGLGCYASTTDAGRTWKWIDIGHKSLLNDIQFVNATHGWIVGENGLLLKTTNGGSTWTPKPVNTAAALRSIDFIGDNVGYIGGAQGVILRTLDGGATWQVTHRAIPSDVIAISFLNAANGVAATTSHSIWRTSDSSKSWIRLFTDTSLAITDLTMLSNLAIRLTGVKVADRAGVIMRSTDNGSTWTTEISRPNTALFAVGSSVASEAVAVGERGKVLSSTDNGATWSARADAPPDLRGISMRNTTSGLAVGDRGSSLITINGAAWSSLASGRTYDLNDVEIGSRIVAVGDSGYVLSSTDLGVNWAEERPTHHDIRGIALGGNNSIAVGDSGTVLRQAAGGSWTAVSSPSADNLHGAFFNDTVLYVVGENGVIFRATDLSFNWSRLPSQTNSTLLDIAVIGDRGWIVGGRGTLLRSSDGGASWDLASEILHETYTSISMAADAMHGILTTLAGDIYSTSNGGDTWALEMSVGHPLFASDMAGSDAWAAGMRGVIAHGILASNSVAASSSMEHALRVTYRKAQLLLTIEADVVDGMNLTIELYDALGKLVQSSSASSEADYVLRLTEPLNSGLYHLRLQGTSSKGEINLAQKILVTN